MDLAYYDLAAARIETIETTLAWLKSREHGDSEQAQDLENERAKLSSIIENMELRLAYDGAAIMN